MTSVTEAARRLGIVDPHTIHRYIHVGALSATLVGNHKWEIDEESVQQLAQLPPRLRSSHRYVKESQELSDEEILARIKNQEAQQFYQFYREERQLPKVDALLMVIENLVIDLDALRGREEQ